MSFSSFESAGKFNALSVSVRSKRDALEEMLLKTDMGKFLIEFYMEYWTPDVVDKYLQGAASYSRGCKAMISVTDLVRVAYSN